MGLCGGWLDGGGTTVSGSRRRCRTLLRRPVAAVPVAPRAPRRLGGTLGMAWVGYRRLLDAEMAEAGFGDRRFPDGRVLRICADVGDATISHVARELGITRQGASKIVADLMEREYVTLRPSPSNGREKIVDLTPGDRVPGDATPRHAPHRSAAAGRARRRGVAALHKLLDALGGDELLRLNEYIQPRPGTERRPHVRPRLSGLPFPTWRISRRHRTRRTRADSPIQPSRRAKVAAIGVTVLVFAGGAASTVLALGAAASRSMPCRPPKPAPPPRPAQVAAAARARRAHQRSPTTTTTTTTSVSSTTTTTQHR